MTTSRQIKKVFLASPGDLKSERALLRSIVDDINRHVAATLGYFIEFLGWEDTLPGFGRPQNLINTDVDGCDLFIGMLWRRWGSAPDKNDKYTSGFEEEYYRAIERRVRTGAPEICIYLKAIDDDLTSDPGEGLKSVLEFRELLVREKRVLYKEFSSEIELLTHVRNRIESFLLTDFNREVLGELKDREGRQDVGPSKNREGSEGKNNSPLAEEGHRFLVSFTDRITDDVELKRIESYDIARFRLLANSLSRHGNDGPQMGVHDLNLLYAGDIAGCLGTRERASLVQFGLSNTKSEVVPVWRWLTSIRKGSCEVLPYYTIDDDTETVVGALMQMRRLTFPLPDTEGFGRKAFLQHWLDENADAAVKQAALNYIRECGRAEDLDLVVAELGRNNSSTEGDALECVIAILARQGASDIAERYAVNISDRGIAEELLKCVEEQVKMLPDEQIMQVLQNSKNARVREAAFDTAEDRSILTADVVEKFLNDSSPSMRLAALQVKERLGLGVSLAEAERVLVKPQRNSLLGYFSGATSEDSDGKRLFERYKTERLQNSSELTLRKSRDGSIPYDDDSYFALAHKNFSKYGKALRNDIDDRFGAYFKERARRLQTLVGETEDKKLVASVQEVESLYREKLTRRGLDLLCEKGGRQDLPRIRKNLKDQFTTMSIHDIQYLSRFGDMSDLDLVLNAKRPSDSLTIFDGNQTSRRNSSIATFILAIGKTSIKDVLQRDIPTDALIEIVTKMGQRTFAELPNELIQKYLSNENDKVRRVTVLKSIIALPLGRISSLLADYMKKENRYYNVIHWLDAGNSLSRSQAKTLAKNTLTRG